MPGVHTDVVPVLNGLVRAMQHIHAERHLEYIVHPIAGTILFRGEEQDLQEILGNLLDNASKWARRRIEVRLETRGKDFLATLDDDGRGIAEEERQRVLNRGERLDEQVPGSGLGLSIVSDLARLYGGGIELGDSPLGGLRISVRLPLAE